MFWLCYEEYRGSKRLRRTWIVEADSSPDEPDESGERLYPFNGMGSYVKSGYTTNEEALEALDNLWEDDWVPEDPLEPHIEVVSGEVVGGEVKVLFPDGTELMCRVGPTNLGGKTLIWVPVHGTWLKMWKSQELLKEIVPAGGVLLAESSADPRLRGGAA